MKTQTNTTEKQKSYKCETCGGWIDYTGELCHSLNVVQHRSKAKEKKCERIKDTNFRTERANKFWREREVKEEF